MAETGRPKGGRIQYEEFDTSLLETYPLKSRPGKVHVDAFARPHRPGEGSSAFIDGLPAILAGVEFRAVIDALVAARRGRRRHRVGPGRPCHQDRPCARSSSTSWNAASSRPWRPTARA